MRLDEAALEQQLVGLLGVPLRVCVTARPASEGELSEAERALCAPFAGGPRLESWLRGRCALKRLLGRLGLGSETASIRFPQPGLSLSHSGEWAVAAGLGGDATSRFAPSGLGIDLELSRTPPERAGRFFLNSDEQAWLGSIEASRRPRELLRLWTAKEAVFKANPSNQDSLLGHYRLDEPAAPVGQAWWAEETGVPYRYATLELQEGFLTAAVRMPIESRP